MKQLNINPAIDKLALDNGLGHWSCVSPLTKHLWIRSDGAEAVYDGINELTVYIPCEPITVTIVDGYSVFDALLCVDSEYPIGEDWAQPTADLPEKTIVPNGCHDCPFVKTRKDYCTVGRDDDQGLAVNHYFINKTFHPECPLLTHSIKVVKSS